MWTEHPRTSHFLALACTHFNVARDIGSRCLARITSCRHAFGRAFDLILFDPLLCTLHRPLPIFLFHSSLSSMSVGSMSSPMRTSANEELGTLAKNNPLTGYEPNFIDNHHISETTEIFIQESSSDSRPSNLHDHEFDDYTIGRALSSPLFQEGEDPASRRQVYHSLNENLLSSQSSSVGHVRTGRLVFDEFRSLISKVRENPRRNSESEQIRILLERQKEQHLADYRAEIWKNTSSKPIMTEEVSKSWMKLSSLNEDKFIVLIKEMNSTNEINNLFMNKYWNKIGIFVKLIRKVLMRWKNWSDFKGVHSTISRRNLVEDRDTILEPTGKIQELQNEIDCLNDSSEIQDAESVRSGDSHVTSQPVFFRPYQVPGGMLSRPIGMPSRKDGPPSIWDTHGISGKRFMQIHQRLLQHLIRKSRLHGVLMYQNTHHHMWRVNVKHQTQLWIRDASQDHRPEIQSSPVREDFQRIMGQTNNDCRFRSLILTNSPRSLVGR